MGRISTKASGVRNQIARAILGITELGAGWPPDAPDLAQVTAIHDALASAIADADSKEAAWRSSAQIKRQCLRAAIELLRIIDCYTDALYSSSSVEKLKFGLEPKGKPMLPLERLLRIVLSDGPDRGTFRFDWEAVKNAVYEIQWSEADDFSSLKGSGVSTSSAFVIFGLEPGVQYWVRVRPVRGGQIAPWSDPATRIAPI